MTTREFKDKFPQYENVEGDNLWNAMEDYALQHSDSWTADYSGGATEEFIGKFNGLDVYMNHNKYWINDSTQERITDEEFQRRQEAKYPPQDWASQAAVESVRLDFLDFGIKD